MSKTEQELQAEDALVKGFVGVETDATPNDHYTVGGVIAGLPVPESDADPEKRHLQHGMPDPTPTEETR